MIRSVTYSKTETYDFHQSKLSPQQAVLRNGGLCSSLIILHTVSTTAHEPLRLLEKKTRFGRGLVPIAGDPSGGWGLGGQDAGAMGVLRGGWEHVKAYLSEARALVSRSHHHQQLSMNEYEGKFMNILSSVIFLFQLSFFLFSSTLRFSLCYFNLPLALPRFIFLCLCLCVLLWCVLGHPVIYHKG